MLTPTNETPNGTLYKPVHLEMEEAPNPNPNPNSNSPESPSIPVPPLLDEPLAKRPKMSSTTTTSDDDEETTAAAAKPHRYKRRKVAIFFAYCGVGYQGMQKNPGAKTIEGDLEEAFFHAGAVPEQDRGIPKRYDWARSARTDKGVSAVGQVVSGRFYIDPPGLVERLNAFLPSQIRIFGFKRVTASFNAKKFCDRRRYVYLIPVFALDKSCHRDRESVMASVGSGDELVKCLECSERGRKVFGVMGKRGVESKSSVDALIASESGGVVDTENEAESGDLLNTRDTAVVSNDKVDNCVDVDGKLESGEGMQVDDVKENMASVMGEDWILIESSAKYMNGVDGKLESVVGEQVDVVKENGVSGIAAEKVSVENAAGCVEGVDEVKLVNDAEKPPKANEFWYDEKEKERFNRILKYYVGTHNFHNFTTRTKAEDPAARRYIVSFDANTTVNVDGIEFVKCEVVGQSFMLHQIRKMIGLAVAIMRDCASESLFEKAFEQNVRINVPTAPEVGLYLDECLFTSYNNKWRDSHEEVSMKDYEEPAEEFKMKYIYPHIAATEHKEGVVALWLHSLNHRNYPDLRCDSNEGVAISKRNDEVVAEQMSAEPVNSGA